MAQQGPGPGPGNGPGAAVLSSVSVTGPVMALKQVTTLLAGLIGESGTYSMNLSIGLSSLTFTVTQSGGSVITIAVPITNISTMWM